MVYETSAHFCRSDGLFNQLVDKRIDIVISNFNIGAPLAFYNLKGPFFKLININKLKQIPNPEKLGMQKCAFVFYNMLNADPVSENYFLSRFSKIKSTLDNLGYYLDDSFDSRFLVYSNFQS